MGRHPHFSAQFSKLVGEEETLTLAVSADTAAQLQERLGVVYATAETRMLVNNERVLAVGEMQRRKTLRDTLAKAVEDGRTEAAALLATLDAPPAPNGQDQDGRDDGDAAAGAPHPATDP